MDCALRQVLTYCTCPVQKFEIGFYRGLGLFDTHVSSDLWRQNKNGHLGTLRQIRVSVDVCLSNPVQWTHGFAVWRREIGCVSFAGVPTR